MRRKHCQIFDKLEAGNKLEAGSWIKLRAESKNLLLKTKN